MFKCIQTWIGWWLLDGDSGLSIWRYSIAVFTHQKHQFGYWAFEEMMILARWCCSQLYFSYKAIFARHGGFDSRQFPFIPYSVVFFNKNQVSNVEVLGWTQPFLTLLKRLKKILSPSAPKLIGEILHSAPSFLAVLVCLLEVSWRRKDHGRLLR